MTRHFSHATFVILACFVMLMAAGCDRFTAETPSDQLPPLPEQCSSLSAQHMNALIASYAASQASQLQITRVANEFAQCLQNEGFSRGDAKGMIKKNEALAKEEVEKSGGKGVHVY